MAVNAHSEDRRQPVGESVSCRQRCGEVVKAGGLPLAGEIGTEKRGRSPFYQPSSHSRACARKDPRERNNG